MEVRKAFVPSPERRSACNVIQHGFLFPEVCFLHTHCSVPHLSDGSPRARLEPSHTQFTSSLILGEAPVKGGERLNGVIMELSRSGDL